MLHLPSGLEHNTHTSMQVTNTLQVHQTSS
jgi:hypothetical protein